MISTSTAADNAKTGLAMATSRRHGGGSELPMARNDMRRTRLIVAAASFCLAGEPATAKGAVYMSLMGEPFWTNAAGEPPFEQWWKLVDQDGDGAISTVEFRADADAFFSSLDSNNDKIIDGDEMADYE